MTTAAPPIERTDAVSISTRQQPASLIPGPKPSLLGWRGNFFQYFKNPIAYMKHLRSTYGDIVKLTSTRNQPLLLEPDAASCFTAFGFGPECNREILSQPEIFQKRNPRGPRTEINKLLINNVAMVTSKKQKGQRRSFMPAFTRKHLHLFYEPMVKSAMETLDQWASLDRILAFEAMLELSANVASRCIYGVDPNSEHGDLAVLMRDFNDAVFNPLAMIPVNLPGTPYRKSINIGNNVFKAVRAEIRRKREAGLQGHDVLTLMLKAMRDKPDLMTEEELIGNAYIMFFAGYETTSLALAWTLFLLAQHPGVMADLMAELDASLHGNPPTFDQIYDLQVLDRIVKESMRILGPTVAFPRYVAEEAALGPYELPAGAEVMYSTYMTHVDPDIYDQPLRFSPERWESIRPTAYEYLPFGTGARTCMGTSFASMQARLVLPMIVQRYRLETPKNCTVNVIAHTQMRPKNGLPMILRDQDREYHKSKAEVCGNVHEMVELA